MVGSYKFFLMERDGRAVAVRTHECADDLAALDMGYEMCANHEVEIWCGALRVAVIPAGETKPVEPKPRARLTPRKYETPRD